jgi:hypothetical protein
MLDIFDLDNRGFSMTEITAAINLMPNRYDRITELGLFSDVPIHTNQATIELKNNSLTLLPTSQLDVPGKTSGPTERKILPLAIPQTLWEDTVLARDVMGIRQFGSDNIYETIQAKVLEKLDQAKSLFDMTDEYRKICALKGIVLDADGTSPLFNSFTFFDITKKSIDFKLGTTSTDVPAKICNVKRYIEDNLLGETMTGVRIFVGPVFYDRLKNHPSIMEIWKNWQGMETFRNADQRKTGLVIEGVVFEEYRGIVPKPDGSGTIKFLEDSMGVGIPMGTRNTFKRFVSPAGYISTVNTLGKPYYARQQRLPDDTGIKLYAQSNTLPICLRPNLIVEINTSD